ncbi:hypothetical protein F5Y18DRAFT_313088 [Xylariaceae sp. FL1019]|nr:hypothetical protein F5Y18DRAFT_313088 [Xylariaceae sp. FL1019]
MSEAVEALCEGLADPNVDRETAGEDSAAQDLHAVRAFLAQPLSDDSDHKFLFTHAQKALTKGGNSFTYFRAQFAQLAVQKTITRKDDSYKARQMRYYKWIAQGKKDETYPFPSSRPKGLPSSTRIATLAASTECEACGKQGATYRCPSCTIQDDQHVIKKTTYCNKTCLEQHRESHKALCNARNILHRTICLLDKMFFAVISATYSHPLAHVFEKNGILYPLHDVWEQHGMTGRCIFWPFPKHLTPSDDIHRALLFWSEAEDINLSFAPMAKGLLKQSCKSIKQVSMSLKNIKRPICYIAQGLAISNVLLTHTVLQVTLPGNEKYAIDMTAPQFGWKETVAPWSTWSQLRCDVQFDVNPFPHLERIQRQQIKARDLEYNQQVLRELLFEYLDDRLDMMVRATNGLYAVHSVLTCPPESYARIESEVMQLIRQSVAALEKNVLRKDCARLFIGPKPDYAVRVACGFAPDLKDIWLSKEEYDKLKASKTDLQKLWDERLDPKIDCLGMCGSLKQMSLKGKFI